jgi:hypothetical protein
MILQISKCTIDNRTSGFRVLGSGAHQTTIHTVEDAMGRRDEDYVIFGDGIDLQAINNGSY